MALNRFVIPSNLFAFSYTQVKFPNTSAGVYADLAGTQQVTTASTATATVYSNDAVLLCVPTPPSQAAGSAYVYPS